MQVQIIFLTVIATTVCAHKKFLQSHFVEKEWSGKWFPGDFAPHMQSACDDGVTSLGIDFDAELKQHNYNFICMGHRELFTPSLDREAELIEHFQPEAYMPSISCMNESIVYDESIPSFGSFRPVAPAFGSYKYLPPQRWLRSLAEGAIVMLYHPCAYPAQVTILTNLLEGCLYRHIITPSPWLSPERPLALVAWGKYLQMSVVAQNIVIDFIRENAKQGPLANDKRIIDADKSYRLALEKESRLVTDEHDSEICGFEEM